MEEFSISLLNCDFDSRISLAKTMAREIAFAVPPIYEGYDFTTPWTVAIKNVLRKMMPPSWKMFPPEDGSSAGEFLVDACWWVDGGGAALVAEFEWHPSWREIVKDFEKLLVIKSPLKLMIYASSKGAISSSEIEGELKNYLSSYEHHIAGETYMFIDYWPNDHVRAFVWQARTTGHAEVHFEDHFKPERFERRWKPVAGDAISS